MRVKYYYMTLKVIITNILSYLNEILKHPIVVEFQKNQTIFFSQCNSYKNIIIHMSLEKIFQFFKMNKYLNATVFRFTSYFESYLPQNLQNMSQNVSLFRQNQKNVVKSSIRFLNVLFNILLVILSGLIVSMLRTDTTSISTKFFYNRVNYEISAGTEMIKSILTLYSNMVVILFVIGIIVAVILFDSIFFYQDTNLTSKRSLVTHNQPLEFIWTTIPAVIITLIAIPTLMWIYLSDRDVDPTITVSVTGHQWYWNYKIMSNNIETADTDAFMLPMSINVNEVENFSNDPSYQYLKTDNYLVVPSLQKLRFTFSANDVIHSWAVPALGMKVDAVPGRATRMDVYMNQEGLFYGQCSELCGVNHAFMPIGVDIVGVKAYLAHTRPQAV